eukprot:4143364-Amphidinium_carterae.1
MKAVFPIAGLVKMHSPYLDPNFIHFLREGGLNKLLGTVDILAHFSNREGYLVVELSAVDIGLDQGFTRVLLLSGMFSGRCAVLAGNWRGRGLSCDDHLVVAIFIGKLD